MHSACSQPAKEKKSFFCYFEIQIWSQQLPPSPFFWYGIKKRITTLILITIFGRYKLIIHLFFIWLCWAALASRHYNDVQIQKLCRLLDPLKSIQTREMNHFTMNILMEAICFTNRNYFCNYDLYRHHNIEEIDTYSNKVWLEK